MSLFTLLPYHERDYFNTAALIEPTFRNLDSCLTLPFLYHSLNQSAEQDEPWTAAVDVRGFAENEVKVTPESNDRRFVVTARKENSKGDFEEMRRSVSVPEDVQIDQITSELKHGRVYLRGARQSPKEQQNTNSSGWKLSEDGQHVSSDMCIKGFAPEEVHLSQHGRWITLTAARKTKDSSVESKKSIVLRSLLPKGVKAETLRAEHVAADKLRLIAETDADKSCDAPRDVPIQAMAKQ